jgi:hypothetical protein
MKQYIGQTKTPLAKDWRLVARGDDPIEVAKKTTALAAKGETMARVMWVSCERWDQTKIVKEMKV